MGSSNVLMSWKLLVTVVWNDGQISPVSHYCVTYATQSLEKGLINYLTYQEDSTNCFLEHYRMLPKNIQYLQI